MVRSFFTWLLLLTTTALLTACCGSTACECNDEFADAIGLRLSTDTLSTGPRKGFLSAEVTTVYLVRVPRDTAQRPKTETVTITRSRLQAVTQPIIINNATPFTRAGNRNLDQYTYELYLAPSLTATPTFRYKIDRVELRTDYEADGCCTCFQNRNKLVYVNGNPTPLNQTDPTGENRLIPLDVTRP